VREASVVAQGKINLFLRVLAREASGYHQLETLFQRLELGDDVRVRVGVPGRALDCRGADVGPTERNLAWRAALAYVEATGWPDGFAIEIDKHVPPGGGLGGGSADAGAVLRCLNALAPRPLGRGDLLALAAPLGADVPFLTAEEPLALAWGRGERMLALPPLPPRRAHLALFDEGVSTAEAFGALAELRASDAGASRPRPIVWTPERFATWDDVALVASNDFEAVVLPLREDVAGIRSMFGDVVRRIAALHDAAAEPEEVVDEEDGAGDLAAPGDPRGEGARESEALDDDALEDDALEDGGSAADAPGRAGGDPAPAAGDRVPIALMTGTGATVYLLSPLSGVALEFEVRGPGEDARAGGLPGLAVLETRTADRVAAVSLAG
jgi:4-diphosphocytidyl-2-C-methyl-D-erythritol kinase